MTSTMMFSGNRPSGRLYDLCGQFFFRLATVELFSLYYSVYDRERQVLCLTWVQFIFLHRAQVGEPDPHKGGHYISLIEEVICSDPPLGVNLSTAVILSGAKDLRWAQ